MDYAFVSTLTSVCDYYPRIGAKVAHSSAGVKHSTGNTVPAKTAGVLSYVKDCCPGGAMGMLRDAARGGGIRDRSHDQRV